MVSQRGLGGFPHVVGEKAFLKGATDEPEGSVVSGKIQTTNEGRLTVFIGDEPVNGTS